MTFVISLFTQIEVNQMGGLLAKYLTDKNAEKSGVWVTYTELMNDDNTYPAFCVKRISTNNVAYQAKVTPELQKLSALQKRIESKPDDTKAISELAGISKRLATIFVDEILVNWRDLKQSASVDENGATICDVDGVPVCEEVPYSKDTARELLGDPDFAEVLRWLMDQSSEISNFLVANRQKDLNS